MQESAKYYYSVWIKAEDIQITTHNGNGGAYIKFDDRYGGDLGGKNVAGSYDWTFYEGYFTPPETGTYSFTCRIWGAYGKAWFDDLCIKKVEEVDSEVLKHWVEEEKVDFPLDDGGFTLVGIGDTQGLAANVAYNDRYTNMAQWLVEQKEELNIQYAMHLGDIVDSCGDANQWVTAAAAHKIMQDGGLKYSLSPGNHDYAGLVGLASGVYVPRDLTTYNATFKREDQVAWLGTENFGTFNDTMDNSWHKFEVDGYKYMIIALELGKRSLRSQPRP